MSGQLLADALLRSKHYHAISSATSREVFQLLDGSRFDVVLISPNFASEPMEGLRLVREIHNLHSNVAIVVLLDTLERSLVTEAFRHGACGVFCRSDSFHALCKCIVCVHAG